jgi:hypothetical protein
MVLCPLQWLTPFSFWDCSKCPEGWGKLDAINPFTVLADLKDVCVIAKLTAPHNAMELLKRKAKFSVGAVRGVTRANGRRRRAGMMDVLQHLVPQHC